MKQNKDGKMNITPLELTELDQVTGGVNDFPDSPVCTCKDPDFQLINNVVKCKNCGKPKYKSDPGSPGTVPGGISVPGPWNNR